MVRDHMESINLKEATTFLFSLLLSGDREFRTIIEKTGSSIQKINSSGE